MIDKNKLFRFNRETDWTEIIFIPLFFSLYLVYHFFHDSGFELEMFNGRSISVATYEGIDIAKRVNTFYNGFFVFVILAFAFTYVIARFNSIFSGKDLKLLNSISAAGICLLFFQVLGGNIQPSLHLIIAIQLLFIAGMAMKSKWNFDDGENTYTPLLVWIISLSFSLFFLQVQLFQLAGINGSQSLPIFVFSFSAVLLLFYFLTQRIEPISASSVEGKIRISAPLAFIPLLSVVSNEIYMILNQHQIHQLDIKFIFGSLLMLLVIWMAYRRKKWRKEIQTKPSDLFYSLNRSWFPILCVGIAALATYKPIVIPGIDWFEDANRILPLQQFHDFGKIPFLDTFSSHAFSDFAPGALFSFLNGYNPLGGFVYQFIIPVIVTLVIYYLVFRITENGLIAAFIALFYPYSDFILPTYYNLIPVSILALFNLYRKQSTGNYVVYFLLIVLMIFWRIDLGSANLVAGIIGLLILCYATPGYKTDSKMLWKGLGLVSAASFILFLITAITYQGNLFLRISEVLGYISSFQSYGLKELSPQKDIKYYSLYFVLPILVFTAAAYAFYRLVSNKENTKQNNKLALAILFLSIFYVANFQRGLVRHTLAEQWDTALTSYGFFILASTVFFNSRFQKNKALGFFAFTSLATLLVINYKFNSPELSRSNTYLFAKQQEAQGLFITPAAVVLNRTPEQAGTELKYKDLDKFLKNNFPDSSTFLDFSNSPMLYYYLHRITPNYFCQIPHTAHNEKLQRDFLTNLNKYDIPVVIFSNVPASFWDYLDGIPNTLRHYRISEYIYKNYKPFAIINNHSVWLKRNSNPPALASSSLISLNNLNGLDIRGGQQPDSISLQANPDENIRVKNIIKSPVLLKKNKKYHLNISIVSGTQGIFSVVTTYSGQHGSETRKTDIRIQGGYSEPFIMLETKEGEAFIQSLELQLPPSAAYSINTIQLNESDYYPDRVSIQPVEHSLKFIPYVWGSFDEISGEKSSGEEILLLNQSYTLEADRETRINIPTKMNTGDGNYVILRGQAGGDKDVDVVLNYGTKNKKQGGFIFTMKHGQQPQNYKIRMSSQYNWSSSEVEWISVYSIGSAIQLEHIEIEKGD